LAEPSGSKYYKAPGAADLKAIYDTIALELNSQLFLTYHSATHTERSYQIVHVEVTWTGPDGQTLARTITYRPPAAAVVAPTQEPVVLTPFPVSLAVALPPGLLEQPHEEAPTTKPT